MKFSLAIILLVSLFLAGCGNNKEVLKQTASGVNYQIHTAGTGDSVKVGDFVTFHMLQIANDSTYFSTYERDPISFQVMEPKGYTDPSDWVTYLREGDSATFYLAADSIFSKNITPPPFIRSGDTVRFVFKMISVSSQEEFMAEEQRKQDEILQQQLQTMKQHLEQQGNTNYNVSDDGIIYTVEQEGSGPKPEPGQTVKVHYTLKTLDGNTIESSKNSEPFEFPIGMGRVIEGWDKGIPLFNVGSKGTLYVPSPLAYGPQGNPSIPPNTPLVFEIELLEIVDKASQLKQEQVKLEQYLKQNNINAQRSPEGIYYKVDNAGTGPKPKPGDMVQVNYTGKLLNGTVFDTSREDVAREAGTFNPQRPYGPLEFRLGEGRVIEGWEKGIPLFNVGGSGTLYVPSSLAYGNQAAGNIPPNSPLIFDIEVVGIK